MQSAQFSLHAAMEEKHWWFLGRRQIIRALVDCVVPAVKDTLIVDVGCGTGGNLAAFVHGYSCLGVDPSADAIQLARSRFPHAQFICGSIPEALREVQPHASLFLLADVLEHVPDDFLFLSTLLESAKPGAYLLLTVPANMALWTEHDVNFGHYRRYDLQRLQQVWSGLPVTVPVVSYYNFWLYPLVRTIRALNRWRGRASGAAGTDFQMPPRPLNTVLQRLFASEATTLVKCLEERRGRGFPYGVSLIALLRREPGILRARTKPPEVPPDPHDQLAFSNETAASLTT